MWWLRCHSLWQFGPGSLLDSRVARELLAAAAGFAAAGIAGFVEASGRRVAEWRGSLRCGASRRLGIVGGRRLGLGIVGRRRVRWPAWRVRCVRLARRGR